MFKMTVSYYEHVKYYYYWNIIVIYNLTLNSTIYFQVSSQAKAILLGSLESSRDRGLGSEPVIQWERTILESGIFGVQSEWDWNQSSCGTILLKSLSNWPFLYFTFVFSLIVINPIPAYFPITNLFITSHIAWWLMNEYCNHH